MTTIPEPVAIQLWSREPLTDAKRAELEQILGGDEKCAVPAMTCGVEPVSQSAPSIRSASDAAPTSEPLSSAVPWADKGASVDEIKRLCGRLAQFCGAPIYISKVRTALAEAGVIKGKPQPKKRRIKRRRKRA